MSNLRRLRSLVLPKTKVKVDPGIPPQPILLKLSQLRINDDYQRQLSRDSTRLASKIATEFDWELYHLLVVSPLKEMDETTGLPLYEVLDGQHTAIAAVSNGHIRELWCWPGRQGETLESRATSFRNLNTQRTAVTPVELFWSDVTSKSEEALEVLAACKRTGAMVVKRPKPYGDMNVGETICTAQLIRLAKAGGRPYVERVLKVCMNLRLAPINQYWILALEELLLKKHSMHYLDGIPSIIDLRVENAVGRLGVDNLVKTSKINYASVSAKERQPVYWWMAYHIKKDIETHVARPRC